MGIEYFCAVSKSMVQKGIWYKCYAAERFVEV